MIQLCYYCELWQPAACWLKLTQTCTESGLIRGSVVLDRMRSDIISLVVNIVVRRAKQEYRASIVTLCEPNEAALLAKVENIFNYLLLNQKHVLTLIKLLDFSFMLTAYIDCICNGATDEQSLERAPNNVEAELNFLNEHVANESVSRFVLHMRQQMNIRK